MAESGKADFLTYRLFLTGWDTSIVSRLWVGMTRRGGRLVAEPRRKGRERLCLSGIRSSSRGRDLRAGCWWLGSSPSPLRAGQQRGAPLRHCHGHGDGPETQNHLRAAHVERRVFSSGHGPPQVRAGTWALGVLVFGGLPSSPAPTAPRCMQVGGRCLPVRAGGVGKGPAEILSPALQPGPQKGSILLQQGELLSGAGQGPQPLENRQPAALASLFGASLPDQGRASAEKHTH